MEKRGIAAPSSSLVPHYRLLPPDQDPLASKKARCWLLGRGRWQHIWRRGSHKNTAAASLDLLGLMRDGTVTFNSGQIGPW